MPGRASLPAIPELIERAPGTAVVVMTQHDDPEYARAALLGGASGFVLKEAAQSELVDAVRAAAAGRTYVNPNLGARLVTLPPPPGAGRPDRRASSRSGPPSRATASKRSRGEEGWASSTGPPI